MRKFWKRKDKPTLARDVIISVRNLSTGEVVKEASADALDYHFSGDNIPWAVFAGGHAYDISVRRRTE